MSDKIDTSEKAVSDLVLLSRCRAAEALGLNLSPSEVMTLATLAAERDRLAAENARLRAEVEAVLQKAAGIVNWFDGNEATSEEVASAVMALSSAGGRAALAEQKADVWRRAIEAAATLASDAASGLCQRCGHPRNNHPYRHPFIGFQPDNLSAAIRALPMPDDLGVGND